MVITKSYSQLSQVMSNLNKMLSGTLKTKSKKWKWTLVNAKILKKDANF